LFPVATIFNFVPTLLTSTLPSRLEFVSLNLFYGEDYHFFSSGRDESATNPPATHLSDPLHEFPPSATYFLRRPRCTEPYQLSLGVQYDTVHSNGPSRPFPKFLITRFLSANPSRNFFHTSTKFCFPTCLQALPFLPAFSRLAPLASKFCQPLSHLLVGPPEFERYFPLTRCLPFFFPSVKSLQAINDGEFRSPFPSSLPNKIPSRFSFPSSELSSLIFSCEILYLSLHSF